MAWYAEEQEQAQRIAVEAKRRVGPAWSWMGRALREAVVAREVAQFLREQPPEELVQTGDTVAVFEAAYKAAGLRVWAKKKKSPYIDRTNQQRLYRVNS